MAPSQRAIMVANRAASRSDRALKKSRPRKLNSTLQGGVGGWG